MAISIITENVFFLNSIKLEGNMKNKIELENKTISTNEYYI